jgi:hypothetical protein
MRASVEETIYSGEAVALTPEMKKQALDSIRAEEAQVNLLRELEGLPPISYDISEEWADLPKKNKVLIIALIAGAAFVAYYFYFRKK